MVISFVVAAVVVLLSVILLIRQRVKEIGIMKAVGASNWQIGVQFGLETTVITVVATVFGILLSLLFGQQIANLFTSSGSAPTVTGAGGFAGRGTAVFGGGGGRYLPAASVGFMSPYPRSSDNCLCISHYTGDCGQRGSGVVYCPGQTGGGIT